MPKRPQLINLTKKATYTLAEIARLRRETMIRLTKQHQINDLRKLKAMLEMEGFFISLLSL